jgi:hypothetical protein
MMVERLCHAEETGRLIYPIGPISEEHRSFMRIGGKTLGAVGAGVHDDTVMALAMCLQIAPYSTDHTYLDVPQFDPEFDPCHD